MYKVNLLKRITHKCLLCGLQRVQLRMKMLSLMPETSQTHLFCPESKYRGYFQRCSSKQHLLLKKHFLVFYINFANLCYFMLTKHTHMVRQIEFSAPKCSLNVSSYLISPTSHNL